MIPGQPHLKGDKSVTAVLADLNSGNRVFLAKIIIFGITEALNDATTVQDLDGGQRRGDVPLRARILLIRRFRARAGEVLGGEE